jgi:hypothetical protein
LFQYLIEWTRHGEEDIFDSLAILVHTAYHLGKIQQALCVVKIEDKK